MNKVELKEVWRDKPALQAIRDEVKRQSIQGWKPWELLLPPDMLWPMISEVSQGITEAWSPVLDGIGIQVGNPDELAIRFVLPSLNPSPVMIRSIRYIPDKKDNIVPVEIGHGNKI